MTRQLKLAGVESLDLYHREEKVLLGMGSTVFTGSILRRLKMRRLKIELYVRKVFEPHQDDAAQT